MATMRFFVAMLASLKASRSPPLDQHSFSAELEKRNFTGRGDKETVNGLYSKVYATMTGSAKELVFGSLKWGDQEATALALVRVRERNLARDSIDPNFLIGCGVDPFKQFLHLSRRSFLLSHRFSVLSWRS